MTSPHSDDQIADDVAICICGSGMDPGTWREMRSEVEQLKRALNDLAEAAEVAAQGGIHGAHSDGSVSE